MVKKRMMAILLMFCLSMTLVQFSGENVYAASKTTKSYKSNPYLYLIHMGTAAAEYASDAHDYEFVVKVKTKNKKNQTLKITETKGGKVGCYRWNPNTRKAELHHVQFNGKNYSGKITYDLYEGDAESNAFWVKTGEISPNGLNHSLKIKLPKKNTKYTVVVRFYVKIKHADFAMQSGDAARYVSGKLPSWKLTYNNKYFSAPTISRRDCCSYH